jgi:SAM-dependent MidA family methyltransferase
MRAIRFRSVFAAVWLVLLLLWFSSGPLLRADVSGRGQLENPSELHDEIQLPAGSEAAVREFFPSFLEYQDLIMFHPKFGYYASGRVSFSNDYQTFPIVLSPYFGDMIAQQIFHMWEGMRQAGSLGAKDRFTIAEFGAGDGALAEQILNYLEQKSKDDARWREFAEQTVYVCYDRSPALSQAQQARNQRFGKRFEAREADATDPTATIAPGSLKGVVLSNELPDAFSVHKVILSANGSAEVAYVVPSLATKEWNRLTQSVPAAVAQQVAAANEAIHSRFFPAKKGDTTYLNRAAFVALLESLVAQKDYEKAVQPLEFHEVYVPARAIPELAAHLRRYAHLYAEELAKTNRGVVTYINLGEEKFVQGAGHILGTGYVLTIDYGANWDEVMTQDRAHLRTYGPAHQAENDHIEPFDVADDGEPQERDTSDPYRGPTLNDITTDVNFSLMEAEGRLAGLTTAYYGRQKALATGTTISIDVIPAERRKNDELTREYQSWLKDFKNGDSFKLMVQQKANTDADYKYPDTEPQPLSLNEKDLSPAQLAGVPAVEKALAGQ